MTVYRAWIVFNGVSTDPRATYCIIPRLAKGNHWFYIIV